MGVRAASSAPQGPYGRFDDLINGCSLVFGSGLRVHVANVASDVPELLRTVEAESRAGNWCYGYLSYEAAPGLDAGLVVPSVDSRPDEALPLAWFAVCDRAIEGPVISLAPPGAYNVERWRRRWDSRDYAQRVERIRAAIARGDTYQCNLTTQLRSKVSGDLLAFYADLAHRQRGAHSAFLDIGTHVIASASPELFFRWSAGGLTMRPMKGTAARGRTSAEDRDQLQNLSASAKERAENVMIVDLLRNDLSRLPGALDVRVPRLCTAERFDTVWQLTSDVTATLGQGTSLLDVFAALFPSGSVTGAPKARTMELIAELETDPRGVYCGTIGYVAPSSHRLRAQFTVAIRTAVIERSTAVATYGTGGAITWDSTARREEDELLEKASILAEPHREFQLLETMAYRPGQGVRNWAAHLARMADSAAYFGFRFDARMVSDRLRYQLRGSGPARIRLLLSRDGELQVELAPLPEAATGSVSLVLDLSPIDSRQHWFFHKTTHRNAYAERARRHPEADDVILMNEHGLVTETTIANLAARLRGRWRTPPLRSGCLPGVERAKLVTAGALEECELTPADLAAATELAVISSLRGWRPAHLLAGARGMQPAVTMADGA